MCKRLHAGLPSRQFSSHKHTVLTCPPVGQRPLRMEMVKHSCVWRTGVVIQKRKLRFSSAQWIEQRERPLTKEPNSRSGVQGPASICSSAAGPWLHGSHPSTGASWGRVLSSSSVNPGPECVRCSFELHGHCWAGTTVSTCAALSTHDLCLRLLGAPDSLFGSV